ncbi:hypothetical protein KPL78_18570 [Roseomonas sp. HJA6]|uniref:Uncharacterized protein n=1 Tax=Roseomonas alba TaxID=2846776 RepID=A0ABS7ACT6_9PROT|nr:hypothetical protein [Neoroseomonas alba]MBW6399870.1 hypothetical protein [Neoroseomonas alba]
MKTMLSRTSSPPDRRAEVEVYWKACAEIRDGEIAIGIADMLLLAGTGSPVLRRCVRRVLAKHGTVLH